jgi:hypothetical protein
VFTVYSASSATSLGQRTPETVVNERPVVFIVAGLPPMTSTVFSSNPKVQFRKLPHTIVKCGAPEPPYEMVSLPLPLTFPVILLRSLPYATTGFQQSPSRKNCFDLHIH